uniref:Uncharacterized protein n=1 Tax=Cajanus cajan TaxID=3821 RepID=A0A151U9A7_CAJCA|nr:hypothetical protein KK1_020035 [Cajanus cajan]
MMVETLIISIIHNFMGNLRCHTLGDFRRCIDDSMIMVLTRANSKETFWKERLLAALPRIFANKVREKIA